MAFFTFSLDSPATPATPASSNGLFTRAPLERSFENQSGSCQTTGDFDADRASGWFTHEWQSMDAFEDWLSELERQQVVEFTRQHTNKSMTASYHHAFQYRCSRGHVRGGKEYEKKYPERMRKVEPKAAGCKAELYIKTYYNTATVLGRFDDNHSHATGDENARFTRIPLDTRIQIAEMLRNGVDPDHILKDLHDNSSQGRSAARDLFVTRADIRRIQTAIEAEKVRLDKNDGISTGLWVQRWLAEGDVLSFKSCDTAAPEGSRLAGNSFHLIIQTEWQRERFAELGESFAGIDGTHNTTCYENTTLFTILVRDKWGHGIPIAWMLSSDGTEATLEFFLQTLRRRNPTVISKRFMTDRDQVQINALRTVYPESELFYCWWHVLHAWQQHFSVHAYPELWELLKTWIRITSRDRFEERWARIQGAAPASFLEYLRDYWMSDVQQAMWSAVYRQNRHIFEESDTNMLVEAWHHVLKGKFLNGKRNRRLDTLICLLHDDVIRHYTLRHRRQLHGFEGPDLEAVERATINERARTIQSDRIEDVGDGIYRVKSQSSDKNYDVDLNESSCTCYSFPRIRFCKHLAAISIHFPEQIPSQEISLPAVSLSNECSHNPPTGAAAVPAAPASSTPNTLVPSAATTQSVANKMRRILARIAVTSSPISTDILALLDSALDETLSKTTDIGVLPKSVAVPPNINSATETARILPRVKTKRKAGGTLREREPYSGGERSGKKARPDALHAPAASELARSATTKENVPPAAPSSPLPQGTGGAPAIAQPILTMPQPLPTAPSMAPQQRQARLASLPTAPPVVHPSQYYMVPVSMPYPPPHPPNTHPAYANAAAQPYAHRGMVHSYPHQPLYPAPPPNPPYVVPYGPYYYHQTSPFPPGPSSR